MSDFSKRCVIRSAYPSIYDDVVFVSEKTMREILSDDLKKVEKRYNRQLDSFAIDNEMLSLKLKGKDRDYDKLNKQYKAQEERNAVLEQEKKSLERKLQAGIANSIRLCREIDGLQWTKRNLQEHIDKIQSEHIDDIRRIMEKRH
ncbi:uncharacterized protein LOC116343411 [Contarinia nasturtii]|uniref:uncharacterized protein LOC116343411 n=1 Tax=Contarinia nasturtii TaxID=265458 RepID=UPI0012D4BDF7|nr:uncharacterized protein LOC116343411 [Contarinia nasturtii]